MQIRRILVPTDFSENSQVALDVASSLAHDNAAQLLIVHVSEPQAKANTEGLTPAYAAHLESPQKDEMESLEQVAPTREGIAFERRLARGLAVDAIVELARTEADVDLIVMGTHGRTGVGRLLMGSVAEGVVRRSPCPVLTIKQSGSCSARVSDALP